MKNFVIYFLLFGLAGGASQLWGQSGGGSPPSRKETPNLLPVQNYAVIDLSGAVSSNPVFEFTLDDNHKAAFAQYIEGDPQKVDVKKWENGVVSNAQTFPVVPLTATEGRSFYNMRLRPSGDYVGMEYVWDPTNVDPDSGEPYFTADDGVLISGGQYASIGTPPPFSETLTPAHRSLYQRFGIHPEIYCSSDTGMVFAGGYTDIFPPNQASYTLYPNGGLYGWGGVLKVESPGKNDYFDTEIPSYINDTTGTSNYVKYHRQSFLWSAQEMNDVGQVLEQGGQNWWDGSQVASTGLGVYTYCYGLTNQGRFLIETSPYITSDPEQGAIWKDNLVTKFVDLLTGTAWEHQIKNVTPLLVSNDNSTDGSFRIVTSVKNNGIDELVLWRNYQPPTPAGQSQPARQWELSRMQFPRGATIQWDHLEVISLDGVIAAIGNAGPNSATPGDDHALLLIPEDSVDVYKSTTNSDAEWQDDNFRQRWFDPLNDTDDLKLRIKFPIPLSPLPATRYSIGIAAYPKGSSPHSILVDADASSRLSPNKMELWMTVGNQRLVDDIIPPPEPEGSITFSTYESAGTQNFNDSERFESDMAAFTGLLPGIPARTAGNWTPEAVHVPEGNVPGWSAQGSSDHFIVGGGAQYLDILGRPLPTGPRSTKRMWRKQPRWFYYSGHGLHEPETIGGSLHAGEVEWREGMEVVFIAGCSILDVNNYNGRKLDDGSLPTKSPGKGWSLTGPRHFLGYNWKAPDDNQSGDVLTTAKIFSECLAYMKGGTTPENSWMLANLHAKNVFGTPTGTNACAISAPSGGGSRAYYYIQKSRIFGRKIVKIAEADW